MTTEGVCLVAVIVFLTVLLLLVLARNGLTVGRFSQSPATERFGAKPARAPDSPRAAESADDVSASLTAIRDALDGIASSAEVLASAEAAEPRAIAGPCGPAAMSTQAEGESLIACSGASARRLLATIAPALGATRARLEKLPLSDQVADGVYHGLRGAGCALRAAADGYAHSGHRLLALASESRSLCADPGDTAAAAISARYAEVGDRVMTLSRYHYALIRGVHRLGWALGQE